MMMTTRTRFLRKAAAASGGGRPSPPYSSIISSSFAYIWRSSSSSFSFSSVSSSSDSNTTNTTNDDDGGGGGIVVLGTGWGGFQLALGVNQQSSSSSSSSLGGGGGGQKVTMISPRNHFLFTPLLPSTAVGTLEPRCIQEPIRTVLGTQGKYIQAEAYNLDIHNRYVMCQSVHDHNDKFHVKYDKLVIAIGVRTNTFGIESIQAELNQSAEDGGSGMSAVIKKKKKKKSDTATTDSNDTTGTGTGMGGDIFFLKQLSHARSLRGHIIDTFEKASLPNMSQNEIYRLLSFIMVGGGPTSCEFTAELHDFVKHDVKRLYPDLLSYVKITLVEAGPALLGPFDKALQEYALGLFSKRDIHVKLGTAVTDVETIINSTNGNDPHEEKYHFPGKRALLSDGTSLEFGTMVWNAGLAPQAFINNITKTSGDDDKSSSSSSSLSLPVHPRNGRILIDEYLRVRGHEGTIWAIGDAAMNDTEYNQQPTLPQLAQVARQQGMYLSNVFNGIQGENEKPFEFFSLGSMAFVGDMKGIYDGSSIGPVRETGSGLDNSSSSSSSGSKSFIKKLPPRPPAMTGFAALLLWRFAYWGRQTSIINKMLIPMYWFKSFLFGRDISRF